MAKQRVFVSFDFDHDEDLRNLLAGQAKHADSPFDFVDASLKEPLTGDWKAKVRARIQRCDQVVVLCGEWTHTATGVAAEVGITQELNKPYFLLKGRASRACTRPNARCNNDTMYEWTWENLKRLIGGAR